MRQFDLPVKRMLTLLNQIHTRLLMLFFVNRISHIIIIIIVTIILSSHEVGFIIFLLLNRNNINNPPLPFTPMTTPNQLPVNAIYLIEIEIIMMNLRKIIFNQNYVQERAIVRVCVCLCPVPVHCIELFVV